MWQPSFNAFLLTRTRQLKFDGLRIKSNLQAIPQIDRCQMGWLCGVGDGLAVWQCVMMVSSRN